MSRYSSRCQSSAKKSMAVQGVDAQPLARAENAKCTREEEGRERACGAAMWERQMEPAMGGL